MRRSILALCALTAACGGAPPPAAVVRPPASPEPPPVASSAPPPVASSAPAPVDDDTYEDLGEIHDPATLVPLFTKNARPAFPKASISDQECWQSTHVTGDAGKDFHALIAACGTPTGSVEYAPAAAGKLHHLHDKRDTYYIKIQGGLCYRFFGVADGTIKNLDILIERKSGDLVGDDKTNGPVAIIESDKPWCMDSDGEYQFLVEVDGPGTGNYVFGVWARPNKR